MKLYKDKLLNFKKKHIRRGLENVKKTYRPYDPGNYLYLRLLEEQDINKKFTRRYIELVYTTLSSWNMNSRGARLAPFEIFLNSLQENKKEISSLANYRIDKISAEDFKKVMAILERLYFRLTLVGKHKGKSKPLLVTFSKTMHFLLPDLCIPIDRKYTLNFFKGNESIPIKKAKQYCIYQMIHQKCWQFVSNHKNLKHFRDKTWNMNTPKIVDNIIIGHMRLRHPKRIKRR